MGWFYLAAWRLGGGVAFEAFMITHDYSEWHEPEKPPFTMEDLVNAVKELMMKYHVTFDEALRHLQEKGIPYNQFMKTSGLQDLIQRYLDELEKQKKEILENYRMDKLLNGMEQEIRRKSAELEQLVAKLKDKNLSQKLGDALQSRNPSPMYNLDWQLSRLQDKPAQQARKLLQELNYLIQQMNALEDLYNRHDFTGQKDPTIKEAERLKERLENLEALEQQLQDALEYGDLFNMEVETLRDILGEEAAQALRAKRDELKRQFNEAIQATGEVDYDEESDIYKITPGAARKIGEKALKEVFSRLFSDGMGRHHATYTGEGNVEMTPTRPYEFGDSLSHLDLPGSLLNSAIRQSGAPGGTAGRIRIDSRDFMVHQTKGAASSAIVMLIDQSGSMGRYGRFYNTKKLALALDSLIHTEYPEDKLYFVTFATFAKQIPVGAIPELAPKPISMMGGAVNMRVDFSKGLTARDRDSIPPHFTNLQKGLELARVLLTHVETKNKNVLLITDGAPTAFYEGSYLYLTYPPNDRTYQRTLREVRQVTDEGITINTFMMGNEVDTGYFGEGDFLEDMHKINKGRLIFPAPEKLTQYVLRDFLDHKRKIIQI
ncbi:MAG TPA: hypothetical protein VMV05_04955 [bacterium]|nr:hypothetical protein [bacterium]